MTQRLKSAICQIALLCGTVPLFLAADDRPRLSDVTIKSILEYRLHETGMQRDHKLQVMEVLSFDVVNELTVDSQNVSRN